MLVMKVALLLIFRFILFDRSCLHELYFLFYLYGTSFSSFFFSFLFLIPQIQENKEGLELLKTAIAKAGYTGQVSFSFFSSMVLSSIQYIKRL